MNYQDNHRADQADGLPTFFIRIRVTAADGQRVAEYKLSCFKAQVVALLIRLVLLKIPNSPQTRPHNYRNVVTETLRVNCERSVNARRPGSVEYHKEGSIGVRVVEENPTPPGDGGDAGGGDRRG